MGKPQQSAPQAPDPSYVSSQQTQSNQNTAIANAWLNNVDQDTPYGSLTYTQNGGQFDNAGNWIPRFKATQTLSPDQQKLYDTQTRVTQGAYDLADQYTGRIADATSQPFNYEGLPAAPVYNEDYRKQQLQAIQDRAAPSMERDRAALEQRLANQGISYGSDAWKAAQDDYGRSVNDFRLGADVQAGNAAAQQYGLEGSTRDRAIAERTNLRTQPINEVAALLGTGDGVRDPSFVPTNNYQIAPTDVSGNYWNAYQGQVAQQQMAQQQNNAMLGGLFGLAGSLGGGYLAGRGRGGWG